ncbi:MAG: aspartate carbamoyltransferase regulatory subunit [Planctomycetes bacterium]|nr:aspartate carbamoyltransferase regulatory subunit [Planctomycetota bacterium]
MADSPSGAQKVRQVEAIANGTVIDHIPSPMTLKVATLLAGPDDQVFMGMNLRSSLLGRKGVVKISGRELTERSVSSLALIAPTASISIIRDYTVVSKNPVPVPSRFEDIARCANPNCVTNHERWATRFDVVGRTPLRVRCIYCERSFDAADLTLI